MGKNSGGSGSGGAGGGGSMSKASREQFKSEIESKIKDPQVRKEMMAAYEMMDKEFDFSNYGDDMKLNIGSFQKFEKLGEGNKYRMGKHNDDGSIEINSRYTKGKYEDVKAIQKATQERGTSVVVDKYVTAKTLVHEMSHGVMDGPGHYKGSLLENMGKMRAHATMTRKIEAVYNDYMKSSSHKGWGSYSRKSAKEFFAEGLTKHMLGTKDKYTTAIYNIAKGK